MHSISPTPFPLPHGVMLKRKNLIKYPKYDDAFRIGSANMAKNSKPALLFTTTSPLPLLSRFIPRKSHPPPPSFSPNYTQDLPHKWSHINSAWSLSTCNIKGSVRVGKNGASKVLGQERREDSELDIKKMIINKAVEVKGEGVCWDIWVLLLE